MTTPGGISPEREARSSERGARSPERGSAKGAPEEIMNEKNESPKTSPIFPRKIVICCKVPLVPVATMAMQIPWHHRPRYSIDLSQAIGRRNESIPIKEKRMEFCRIVRNSK
jgi:hypothetical protein